MPFNLKKTIFLLEMAKNLSVTITNFLSNSKHSMLLKLILFHVLSCYLQLLSPNHNITFSGIGLDAFISDIGVVLSFWGRDELVRLQELLPT